MFTKFSIERQFGFVGGSQKAFFYKLKLLENENRLLEELLTLLSTSPKYENRENVREKVLEFINSEDKISKSREYFEGPWHDKSFPDEAIKIWGGFTTT